MRRWPLAVLLVTAAPLVAQSPPAAPAAPPPHKQVRAVRLDGGASIKLDGHLDDAAWAGAPWITDFTQKMPKEGAPPTDYWIPVN